MSTQPPLSSRSPRLRRRWRVVATATAAAVLLALAACAGGGASSSDSGGDSAGNAVEPAAADGGGGGFAAGEDESAERAAAPTKADGVTTQDIVDQPTAAIQRSVISTGVVALRADDVADLRSRVWQVVDEHGGQVTDEETESDTDGEVARARLVVRVPAKEFDAAMAALAEVGDVESSNRSSEDVTTQVIDTNVRLRAQEASLERVEALLARAQSLRDIVAIEAQLTRRQADLDSLKQQQAWLADQTSMSTITVHLRQTRKPATKADKDDDRGFLPGLASGWQGLKKVTEGALTALGALLPFAVVLLVLGAPLWLVVRRLQRRRAPAEPDPAAAG